MLEFISREDASDLLAMALIDDWEPEYAQDRLNEIPAADVRPVVTAHWIDYKPEDPLDPRMKCSHCGIVATPLSIEVFCPKCGAEMTEAKDNG